MKKPLVIALILATITSGVMIPIGVITLVAIIASSSSTAAADPCATDPAAPAPGSTPSLSSPAGGSSGVADPVITASPTATVQPVSGTLPSSVGPYHKPEQIMNAALIIKAGQAMNLPVRGVTIGVMTAMGESSLINIDYGDAAGPDSRGLFGQRDIPSVYGTYADRMNPTIAATNFFKTLIKVPNYLTLEPTIAAHLAQRNADPYHYRKSWGDAVLMVATLTKDPGLLESLPSTPANSGCDPTASSGIGFGVAATCGDGDSRGKTDGTIVYPGTCWFGGRGVPIYANGGSVHGTKYQCTELVRRFWKAMGWAPQSWNGGVGKTLWNWHTPAGAISEPQGSITQLAAGDILSMEWGDTPTGHVGIVNYIKPVSAGRWLVQMASQNTPAAMWYFDWDGHSLVAHNQGFPVTGVMHHIASGTGSVSSLQQLVTQYAWPTNRGQDNLVATPAYQSAVAQAKATGHFYGYMDGEPASRPLGIHCSAFVSLVITNSGWDPTFNYSGLIAKGAGFAGPTQLAWLKQHWKLVGSASSLSISQLQPGDIGISNGGGLTHVWLYVGKVPGFNGNFAEASFSYGSHVGFAPQARQSSTPLYSGYATAQYFRRP